MPGVHVSGAGSEHTSERARCSSLFGSAAEAAGWEGWHMVHRLCNSTEVLGFHVSSGRVYASSHALFVLHHLASKAAATSPATT